VRSSAFFFVFIRSFVLVVAATSSLPFCTGLARTPSLDVFFFSYSLVALPLFPFRVINQYRSGVCCGRPHKVHIKA
jgi:hypothetical protein